MNEPRACWRSVIAAATAVTAIATGTAAAAAAPAAVGRPEVPSGFRPESTSWLTPNHGFVLGYAPCPTSTWCPALVETTDAGRTWHRRPAPRLLLPDTHDQVLIVFGSARDAFASDGTHLITTHDAGRHWSPARITAS